MKAYWRRFVRKALSRMYKESGVQLDLRYARWRKKVIYLWGAPAQYLRVFWKLRRVPKVRVAPSVRSSKKSRVDKYWSHHTVWSMPFLSEEDSLAYVKTLSEGRPYKSEYCQLYWPHTDEVVMDYGCGPGNDLVGWAVYSKARKIIGVDNSWRALSLARQRLALHDIDRSRLDLLMVSDTTPEIPLPAESIDHIHCLGVLHHVSHPKEVLREFYRLMRRTGESRIMVYNALSIWVNLRFGYELQVLKNEYRGMSPESAFESYADLGAPVARCYYPDAFCALCEEAGFAVSFLGGYFVPAEMPLWRRLGPRAIRDARLRESTRTFLRALEEDGNGCPTYKGRTCGLGGVYHLRKEC